MTDKQARIRQDNSFGIMWFYGSVKYKWVETALNKTMLPEENVNSQATLFTE